MKTILVLTDFSERSEYAAECAWQIASKIEADILLFNAYYYVPQTEDAYAGIFPVQFKSYSAFEQESLVRLSELTGRLTNKFKTNSKDKIPSLRYQNEMGDLADNVQEVLNKEDIWMIVMGDKRVEDFLAHFALNSDADGVLRNASCPVLMVPEKVEFNNFSKMALALASFEQPELNALKFMAQLALPFDAQLLVIHVDKNEVDDKKADKILEEFYEKGAIIEYEKISFHEIRGDDITTALVKFEQIADLDLIALVHKKHPFLEQLFHKSTAEKLMGYHTIPLLVFPPAYTGESVF
jgi:nucleotide-binding universal stress UspA family protein